MFIERRSIPFLTAKVFKIMPATFAAALKRKRERERERAKERASQFEYTQNVEISAALMVQLEQYLF